MEESIFLSSSETVATFERKYLIEAKVGEGTFGEIFKAREKNQSGTPLQQVAIKSFKGGQGISFTTCQLKHENIVSLKEVFLDPHKRALYLVFEYAEHDLCSIIKYHREDLREHLKDDVIRSFMFQIFNGMNYLHNNWIVHRDLKPSNILVMGRGPEEGCIKIADFGLARVFKSPLRPLHENGVVVTIWYRAPELLLGSHHYTRAIDNWALGCIFAELIICKPIFPGQDDQSSQRAFQANQLQRIFKILGTLTPKEWPLCTALPEWHRMEEFPIFPRNLSYEIQEARNNFPVSGLTLLSKLLHYDPAQRMTSAEALSDPYFDEGKPPTIHAFRYNDTVRYPDRPNMTKSSKK